jgi:peroxisomal membrane protein 4
MILLYRRHKSFKSNLDFLIRAAKQHAINLGLFVSLFKYARCQLINLLSFSAGRASLISGAVFGALIWGRQKTAINNQVVLYLLSRVVTGFVQHHVNQGNVPDKRGFGFLAAFVWAMVMYIFTVDPDALQGSLRTSMDFLYSDEKYATQGSSFIQSLLPFVPFSGV